MHSSYHKEYKKPHDDDQKDEYNDVDDLNDVNRHFSLTSEEIRSINPNTLNCPIFRNKRDAEITKAVYQIVPVLVDETKEEKENPWSVSFLRMFDMAGDSGLFRTKEQLEEAGFELNGKLFINGNKRYLPLYEGKMIWQFDHRFGTFEGVTERGNTNLPTPGESDHLNPEFVVKSWYWVSEDKVNERVSLNLKYFIAYRGVTNATNEKTGVFSLIPRNAVNHNVPLVFFSDINAIATCLFLSNVNSLPFDYILRNKMGTTYLTYFIVKQLPMPTLNTYTSYLINIIAPKTIELIYTAWDLEPFAQDVLNEIGADTWNQWFPQNPLQNGIPQPFRWDEERRAKLRAELDAIYAHLYGISKDDLDYILNTFPIVKRKDEAKYGTYRTKDLILQYYNKYNGKIEPVSREEN